MTNPYELIDARLSRIEATNQEVLAYLRTSTATQKSEVGGIELAKEVTGYSAPRIYALVTEKDPQKRMPHSKRGGRLFFNRAELLAWIAAGKRGEN